MPDTNNRDSRFYRGPFSNTHFSDMERTTVAAVAKDICEVCITKGATSYKGYYLCGNCQENINWDEWNQGGWAHSYEFRYVYKQMRKLYEKLPNEIKVARAMMLGDVSEYFEDV